MCVLGCNKDAITEFNSPRAPGEQSLSLSVRDFVQRAMKQPDPGGTLPANLRSNSLFTPAQAMYYLNHGLNYAYCRPNENYARQSMVSDTFLIPLDTSTMVKEVDLLAIFEQIAEMAGNFYHAVSDTTKQPFHFEIWPYDNLQAEGIPIIAVFTMGLGSCSALNSYPYASTDEWYIGPEAGNCYFQTQTHDAMDHWRCDLNANLNYRDKHLAYYFTDRYSVCFDPDGRTECQGYEIEFLAPHLVVGEIELLNPNDPTPNDNWYDYLLFFNTEWYSNYHLCLTQSEMNFHYQEMAALSVDHCPQGKVAGKHEVGCQLLIDDKSTWFALMRVDYFTRNVITAEGDWIPETLPCQGC